MRDESLVIGDMIIAAERMIAYAIGVAPADLGTDPQRGDAILFNLAVLGEAAKAMPPEVRAIAPDIPWVEMAMTRDKVIHHYHGIDWAVVADVVSNVLPRLLPHLKNMRDTLRRAQS